MKTLGLIRACTLAGIGCGMLLGTTSTDAAIVVQHQYDLGEAGSIVGGLPQDSVGGSHFTNVIPPGFTASSASPSPVSGTYVNDTGAVPGVYGSDYSGFATDNFGIELWVRTADVNQTTNDFFVTNADNTGSAKFTLTGGNWAASYHGVAWIGAASGAGQAATANAWTHLAIIRDNGTSTFYINGVAQAGTTIGTPDHGAGTGAGAGGHLGVTPGGLTGFVGDLDALRLFTFEQGDDPVAFLSIPEPGSLALMGLGGLALLRRRR